jgi:hypothetical protein
VRVTWLATTPPEPITALPSAPPRRSDDTLVIPLQRTGEATVPAPPAVPAAPTAPPVPAAPTAPPVPAAPASTAAVGVPAGLNLPTVPDAPARPSVPDRPTPTGEDAAEPGPGESPRRDASGAAAQIPRQRVATPGEEQRVKEPGAQPGRIRVDETAFVAAPRSDDTAVIPAQTGTAEALSEQTRQLPILGTGDETAAEALARAYERQVVTRAEPEPVPATAPRRDWAPWIRALGRAPEVLAVSAAGVALVALAYLGGRDGASWASGAYWLGQFVVFCPVVVRLLSRRSRPGTAETYLLVLGLAVNQYLTKVCYSPDQFRFPDELQHWAGTRNLLSSGKLFTPNWALPVSVHFPGLEEAGAAVSSMTGLPVTAAGLVVAGVAHLAFVAMLFAVIHRATRSAAIAGLTCVIYATALHYLFFDSMYIYQTVALPFAALAVWATVLWQQGPAERRRLVYPILALVGVFGATVSHHVTAGMTIAALVLLALCDVIFERPRRLRVLPVAGAAIVILVAWMGLVATDITGYLGPPVTQMVDSVKDMINGTQSSSGSAASAASPALWELAIEALGLLCLLVIFLRAIRPTLRARDYRAWRWALLLGAAAFFATNGVRFVGAQGPELAGRASTFAYLPISALAAIALVEWGRNTVARTRVGSRLLAFGRRWELGLGVGLSALLMVGARVGGWPPRYERLPGGYALGAFEKSVNPISVSAARWTGDWLGYGYRFAADTDGLTLLSTYGGEDPVNTAAPLYYDSAWSLADQTIQDQEGVDFVWVDLRLAQHLPLSGQYFPVDPKANEHTSPIPVENLRKFDDIVGVGRPYDNGTIIIYDLRATG